MPAHEHLGMQFSIERWREPSEEDGYHDNYAAVTAHRSGKALGSLTWSDRMGDPVIDSVEAHVKRQGVATALYHEASRHEPNLLHHDTFTEEGLAWARKVGGPSVNPHRVTVMKGSQIDRREPF